jgi:hypothetical protein
MHKTILQRNPDPLNLRRVTELGQQNYLQLDDKPSTQQIPPTRYWVEALSKTHAERSEWCVRTPSSQYSPNLPHTYAIPSSDNTMAKARHSVLQTQRKTRSMNTFLSVEVRALQRKPGTLAATTGLCFPLQVTTRRCNHHRGARCLKHLRASSQPLVLAIKSCSTTQSQPSRLRLRVTHKWAHPCQRKTARLLYLHRKPNSSMQEGQKPN